MPIDNPASLVEEFKKSGEFDRLRREVLARFQQDGTYSAFMTRVEEIGRQRLSTDQTLQYSSQETVQKELAQEVERYPIVERAVTDVRIFSDATFLANLQSSIQKILHDEPRGQPALLKAGEAAIKGSTTQHVNDTGDAMLPVEVFSRVSSIDTMPDIITSSQKSGRKEPAESSLSNADAAEPINAPAPSSLSASTSKANLVTDDPHAMEVDPRDDQNVG